MHGDVHVHRLPCHEEHSLALPLRLTFALMQRARQHGYLVLTGVAGRRERRKAVRKGGEGGKRSGEEGEGEGGDGFAPRGCPRRR